MFGGADRAYEGEQGAGRAGEGVAWCFGEQVQPVRVSRGWEDRGSSGELGEQVQPVWVSRGWEDKGCPWCLGEQVQLERVSRGLGGQRVPQEL